MFADIDRLPGQAHGLDDLRQQAGPPCPQMARPGCVFIRSRRFPNKHQFRVDVAHAEHHGLPAGRQVGALDARQDPLAKLIEGRSFVIRRSGRRRRGRGAAGTGIGRDAGTPCDGRGAGGVAGGRVGAGAGLIVATPTGGRSSAWRVSGETQTKRLPVALSCSRCWMVAARSCSYNSGMAAKSRSFRGDRPRLDRRTRCFASAARAPKRETAASRLAAPASAPRDAACGVR